MLTLSLSFLLGAAAAAPAQAVRLEVLVHEALRRNPTLASAAAQARADEARFQATAGLDDLRLSLSAAGNANATSTGGPPSGATTSLGPSSLSLTQPLPVGATLGLAVGVGTTLTGEEASLQATLTMPLLRGFGAPVARAAQRRARVVRDVSELLRQAAALDLMRDVSFAYWDLAEAVELLAIQRESTRATDDLLERVKAFIEVQRMAPSDSAEVEVSAAIHHDQLISAEQLVAKRSLELQRLCHLESDPGDLGSISAVLDEEPALPSEAGALVAQALARNPRVAASSVRKRGSSIELEVAENALFPQLDLSLSAGPTATGASVSRAVADAAHYRAASASVALAFDFPFANRVARGQRAAALQAVRQAGLDEVATASDVRTSVLQLRLEVEMAGRRRAALEKVVDLARIDLDAQQARFAAGRATSYDVLRRQDNLTNARAQKLAASLARARARVQLDALTGQLFDLYGATP